MTRSETSERERMRAGFLMLGDSDPYQSKDVASERSIDRYRENGIFLHTLCQERDELSRIDDDEAEVMDAERRFLAERTARNMSGLRKKASTLIRDPQDIARELSSVYNLGSISPYGVFGAVPCVSN